MKTKYEEERKMIFEGLLIPPELKRIIDSLDYTKVGKLLNPPVKTKSALIRKSIVDILKSLGIETYEDAEKRGILKSTTQEEENESSVGGGS